MVTLIINDVGLNMFTFMIGLSDGGVLCLLAFIKLSLELWFYQPYPWAANIVVFYVFPAIVKPS